jgi:hypothetical protein
MDYDSVHPHPFATSLEQIVAAESDLIETTQLSDFTVAAGFEQTTLVVLLLFPSSVLNFKTKFTNSPSLATLLQYGCCPLS